MRQVLLVVRHEAPIRNRSATRRAIDHRFSRVFNASDTSSLGMFRKNEVYCVDYSKDDDARWLCHDNTLRPTATDTAG